MTYKLTWAAILVCFLLTIIGLFVGGVAAWLYKLMLMWFLVDSIFTWIGLDIVNEIFLEWFPALLQGGVGGYLGIFVTSKIFKYADYNVVAYSASALVIGSAVLSFVILVAQDRLFDLTTVAIIASTIGTVVAYFIGKTTIDTEQRYLHLVSEKPETLEDYE